MASMRLRKLYRRNLKQRSKVITKALYQKADTAKLWLNVLLLILKNVVIGEEIVKTLTRES